jgi:hypothetical protein
VGLQLGRLRAGTSRAGWVAYLWCVFCAVPTRRGRCPHPAASTRLPRELAWTVQHDSPHRNCTHHLHTPLITSRPAIIPFCAHSCLPNPTSVARGMIGAGLPAAGRRKTRAERGIRKPTPLLACAPPKSPTPGEIPALSAAPTRHTLISDGTARAPRVRRAVLVAAPGWHAVRTCMRLCGCAGGSYPSHPALPVHRPHGSEAHGANEPQQRNRTLASVEH